MFSDGVYILIGLFTLAGSICSVASALNDIATAINCNKREEEKDSK